MIKNLSALEKKKKKPKFPGNLIKRKCGLQSDPPPKEEINTKEKQTIENPDLQIMLKKPGEKEYRTNPRQRENNEGRIRIRKASTTTSIWSWRFLFGYRIQRLSGKRFCACVCVRVCMCVRESDFWGILFLFKKRSWRDLGR